jgi:hypothetical protein
MSSDSTKLIIFISYAHAVVAGRRFADLPPRV